MTDVTVRTIRADEIQILQAPELVAMVSAGEFAGNALGTTNTIEQLSLSSDGGFTGLALVLVLSFVSVVTISRRPHKVQA